MYLVASFHDYLSAHHLVLYLREHGVPANVSGELLDAVSTFGGLLEGQYRVSVVWKEYVGPAKSLAKAFRTETIALDDNWEENAEPDLTLLDPAFLPQCGSCRHQFFEQPSDGLCPACHEPVDFTDLILEQHGPEALESCYANEPIQASFDDDAVRALDLPCLRCGYSLQGLDVSGKCPECGQPFDKVGDEGWG